MPATEQQAARIILRMRPGETAVIRPPYHDIPVLCGGAKEIHGIAVPEQAAPERARNVGDVPPRMTVILRTVHTGEVLLAHMIHRAPAPEIIVRGKQCSVRQPEYARAAKIGARAWVLVFDGAEPLRLFRHRGVHLGSGFWHRERGSRTVARHFQSSAPFFHSYTNPTTSVSVKTSIA